MSPSNSGGRCVHGSEFCFPTLQRITLSDAISNISRFNTQLIPRLLSEGGRKLKSILGIQLTYRIHVELQVVEGVSVGARNDFLGPSIVRPFSLVLPPRRIAVDHMKTYRKSLKGIQCKSQWMVHACRHPLEHHCQLMDVDHAGVSRRRTERLPGCRYGDSNLPALQSHTCGHKVVEAALHPANESGHRLDSYFRASCSSNPDLQYTTCPDLVS